MLGKTPQKLLVLIIAVSLVGSAIAMGAAIQHEPATPDTQEKTHLRVVHASPDAPAVDVMVENETVLSNVSFGAVSDYLTLSAGTYNVTIASSGNNSTTVFDGEVTLEPRTTTTLAASGELSENFSSVFEPVFYDDSAFTPGENESAIRVIHLSPDAPPVDVTAGNGSVVLADNISYQDATDYMTVPAGNYTAEIRSATAENNGTIVATANVSLEGGTAYSALAMGYVTPSEAPAFTPFEVVATEDATSTVHLPSDEFPSAVRVTHLSPDAPAVDITAGNGSVVLADNVSFEETSEYVTVPPGDYTVEIRAETEGNNGSVVTTVDVSLAEGTAYSAVATGYLEPADGQEAFEVLLMEDGTDAVMKPMSPSTDDGETNNSSDM